MKGILEQYKVLTVTHKTTSLKRIGEFVIKAENAAHLEERLQAMRQQFGIDELLYVPTCNRVLYLFKTERSIDSFFASHFFQSANPSLSIDVLDSIEDYVLILEGLNAVDHFLDVAASIDSLVIGERQILGQLREAYEQANSWNLIGDNLRLLFQHAVVSAKAVYSKTRIGDKPVSIASLAVQQLLRSNVSKQARILVIGAGQTNTLVGKFLVKHHFENITVFNRSLGKAEQLAKLMDGRAFPLTDLANYREGFDCLIVCTGATEPIITKAVYEQLLQGETSEKVVIDLAIPNNVSEEAIHEFSFNYIEIDGLRQLAKENLAFREQELTKAKELLKSHLSEFPTIVRQRQMEIAMRRVPEEIKAVKTKAINEVFRKDLELLDDTSKEVIERMLAYMEKKCIGIPMRAAREAILQ
ncbi:MAG: glutamyl-tRNA reductase [Bacteroidota bacterium]